MSETKHAFNCQEPGCLNPADEYKLPDPANMDGPDVIYHYCRSHARDAGFCPECTRFFGGIESFVVNLLGVCAECHEAIQDCVGDSHEDDEVEPPLLSFDELNLPRVDDPENGLRATFERIAAANPHKKIKCWKCNGESFIASISPAHVLGLFCDACGELTFTCTVQNPTEFDKTGFPVKQKIIEKTVQKGERDN